MVDSQEVNQVSCIKFFIERKGKEVARAFLIIFHNELDMEQNGRPMGLLEDVFVDEDARNGGLGTEIIQAVIEKAKSLDCCWLVGTSRYSRPRVHELYLRLGFKDRGKEFRMDFSPTSH